VKAEKEESEEMAGAEVAGWVIMGILVVILICVIWKRHFGMD
jgi:hypothetical protein